MGMAKAEMLRLEELEECGAEVQFDCAKCGHVIEDYVEVPPIDIAAEKQSEVQQTLPTDVICSECGKKYVIDTLNTGADLAASLKDHPKVSVHIEPPAWFYEVEDTTAFDESLLELEPWFGEIANSPFQAYRIGSEELDHFIQRHCEDDFVTIENRMAVTQAWSIFETYLGDQLSLYLDQHTEALIRFARSDGKTRDLKLDLAGMIENDVSLKDLVIRSAKSRVFHNFGKPGTSLQKSSGVPSWFRIGLQLSVLTDDAKLERLRLFATMRHDCVHRNGKDHEGSERADVRKPEITELRTLMDEVANHINATLLGRNST